MAHTVTKAVGEAADTATGAVDKAMETATGASKKVVNPPQGRNSHYARSSSRNYGPAQAASDSLDKATKAVNNVAETTKRAVDPPLREKML